MHRRVDPVSWNLYYRYICHVPLRLSISLQMKMKIYEIFQTEILSTGFRVMIKQKYAK